MLPYLAKGLVDIGVKQRIEVRVAGLGFFCVCCGFFGGGFGFFWGVCVLLFVFLWFVCGFVLIFVFSGTLALDGDRGFFLALLWCPTWLENCSFTLLPFQSDLCQQKKNPALKFAIYSDKQILLVAV